MRRTNSQLRIIASSPAPSTKLSDTSGNPSESFYWPHMATVRREWLNEFWRPHADPFEITLAEMRRIESQVRRELYP